MRALVNHLEELATPLQVQWRLQLNSFKKKARPSPDDPIPSFVADAYAVICKALPPGAAPFHKSYIGVLSRLKELARDTRKPWAVDTQTELNFAKFEAWFRQQGKTDKLTARQVWTEIQSTIQGLHAPLTSFLHIVRNICLLCHTRCPTFAGGVRAMELDQMPLPEKEYLDPKKTGWTNMRLEQKKATYAYFKKYRRWRDQKKGCWDIGLRNWALYRRLHCVPSRPDVWFRDSHCPFDRISVDEVQDITDVELAIVLCACGYQPNHLTLCGDDAQQVTAGIIFRFTSIRTVVSHLIGHVSEQLGKTLKPVPLFLNYRSNSGIVYLSSKVLNLRHRFDQVIGNRKTERPGKEKCAIPGKPQLRIELTDVGTKSHRSPHNAPICAGPKPKFVRMTREQFHAVVSPSSSVKLLFLDEKARDEVGLKGVSLTTAVGVSKHVRQTLSTRQHPSSKPCHQHNVRPTTRICTIWPGRQGA